MAVFLLSWFDFIRERRLPRKGYRGRFYQIWSTWIIWGLHARSRTHTSCRIRIHFGSGFGLKLSFLWQRGDLFEFQTNISGARHHAD